MSTSPPAEALTLPAPPTPAPPPVTPRVRRLGIPSSEQELSERLNEVDVLLAALRQLSHDGHTIARPLALVLTKWDTQGPLDADDPAEEEQRALAFLNTRPSFRQLYHALLQAGRSDRIRLFPVSAFGSN